MSAAPSLKQLSRWITAPSTVGGAIGAVLAVAYGAMTLKPPPGTLGWLTGIVAVVVVALTLVGDFYEQRGVRTIRALGTGALPVTREHLRLAVREAYALPDLSFRVNLRAWVVGSTVAGLVLQLVPTTPWGVSLRVMYLGAALGPLSAMITYLLLVERSRRAVLALAELGLSPQEVIEALPSSGRHLRKRLVLFVGVAVTTPSLFIGDLVASRADDVMELLLAAPDRAQQEALVAHAGQHGGLSMAVLVAALGIAAAYLGGTALARPLQAITKEATRITQGDLMSSRLIPAEDEVWAASAAFTVMEAQLAQALTELRRAGTQISGTAEQLLSGGFVQNAGATAQATALNQTSATTEELARSAGQIAGNASEVSDLAERTLQSARSGQRSSEAFFASMVKMREENQRVADSVLRLNKRVQQIGKIVEFINGVGDKSDLLALNAELEGTKAGEVGRGFSLVAAEMRRLAENVIRSTQEIERLIAEIRDGTHAAVMATESGMKAMDQGILLANGVLESLNVIVNLAQSTSESVRAISLATQQQGLGTDQLATAMGEILRITIEGKASSEQVGRANADLSELAEELRVVVDSFRLADAREERKHG
ncbi:MAG TPA: methyl-accepting chemotaxis protein [Myxococcaceae bacterium]|nr:methyl-accepting chemotaxis protein [Myxococcaceae bacterium]